MVFIGGGGENDAAGADDCVGDGAACMGLDRSFLTTGGLGSFGGGVSSAEG